MIPADALHRLVRNLIGHVLAEAEDGNEAKRSSIVLLVESHDLDLQDTATLLRVAAGEGIHP